MEGGTGVCAYFAPAIVVCRKAPLFPFDLLEMGASVATALSTEVMTTEILRSVNTQRPPGRISVLDTRPCANFRLQKASQIQASSGVRGVGVGGSLTADGRIRLILSRVVGGINRHSVRCSPMEF